MMLLCSCARGCTCSGYLPHPTRRHDRMRFCCGTISNGTLVRSACYSRPFLRQCGQPHQLGEKQVACPYLRARGCRRAQTHLHSIRGRTSIAGWVLGDRPRSCMSSRMRWRKGVMTLPPVRGRTNPNRKERHVILRSEECGEDDVRGWQAPIVLPCAQRFVQADDGAGATGPISRVANTCLCQFEPRKYGDG